MPRLNMLHEVALEVADTLAKGQRDADKARPIPFGMQKVDSATWRRMWEKAPPPVRRQMAEALGDDLHQRVAELVKRLRRERGNVPFGAIGGEK